MRNDLLGKQLYVHIFRCLWCAHTNNRTKLNRNENMHRCILTQTEEIDVAMDIHAGKKDEKLKNNFQFFFSHPCTVVVCCNWKWIRYLHKSTHWYMCIKWTNSHVRYSGKSLAFMGKTFSHYGGSGSRYRFQYFYTETHGKVNEREQNHKMKNSHQRIKL